MKGTGGFWNRAGRRSGGNRPISMHVPRYSGVLVSCDQCNNDMLPVFVTQGCGGCRDGAALIERANAEFGVANVRLQMEKMHAADLPAPPTEEL